MTDGLTKFEKELNKPRAKWSKADWRKVAHDLAGVKPTKGRPTLSDEEKKAKEQNIRAAEFWRDQAIETESVPDGYIGIVINRKTKLNHNTATKVVLVEALARNDVKVRGDKLVKKADALVREIQVMQKNRREK